MDFSLRPVNSGSRYFNSYKNEKCIVIVKKFKKKSTQKFEIIMEGIYHHIPSIYYARSSHVGTHNII